MNDEQRIVKLRGVADGFRGASSELTVSRQDAEALGRVSGKKISCEGASCQMKAKEFCSLVDSAFKKLLNADTPAE